MKRNVLIRRRFTAGLASCRSFSASHRYHVYGSRKRVL